MKSNKGITLVSLAVYIVVLCVLLGTMSTIIKYFYSNVNEVTITNDTADKYSRFISYLTNDLNSGSVQGVAASSSVIGITLSSSIHQYTYNDNQLSYIVTENGNTEKQIILCENVRSCVFSYSNNKLNIEIQIGEITYNNVFSI